MISAANNSGRAARVTESTVTQGSSRTRAVEAPGAWFEQRHSPGTAERVPMLLVGERERRLYVLRVEDFEYIEAHGNYVELHARDATYIRRDSVKRLTPLLAPSGFIRIERGLLVNMRAVLYLQRVERSAFAFTLNSGCCLCSSATYREEIIRVLHLPRRGALSNAPET